MTDSEKLAVAINVLKALDAIMRSQMEDDADIRWAGMVYMTDFIDTTLKQIEGTQCEPPKT